MDRRGGLAVYRLVANAPAVFVGWTRMVTDVLDSPTFSPETRELVVLRVATARVALGDEARTELLILVSLYYGLALVLNAAELELDRTVRLRA